MKTGFLLSCLLTIGMYFAAVTHTLSPIVAMILIGLGYGIQTSVQFVCFMRVGEDPTEEKLPLWSFQRWSVNFFLFTVLIALVIVIGSLWIMYNLNYRM